MEWAIGGDFIVLLIYNLVSGGYLKLYLLFSQLLTSDHSSSF